MVTLRPFSNPRVKARVTPARAVLMLKSGHWRCDLTMTKEARLALIKKVHGKLESCEPTMIVSKKIPGVRYP